MRILVVTHEVSRTGAPRIALLVTHALVEAGHQVHVVSRRTGPLLEEFEAAAPTTLEPLLRVRRRLWLTRGLRWLALLVDELAAAATILRRRPDVVYINSTSAAAYLRPSLWLRRAVILHAHESEELMRAFLAPQAAVALAHRASLIACSPSVHTALSAIAGVSAADIALVLSVPDADAVERLAGLDPDHDYAAADLVVGCCGSVEPRKGADLWLAVADRVLNANPEASVRFVWVGELVDPPPGAAAAHDVFLGPSANPYAHMRRFDVATLPSRDDPFPLVVLEAMLAGTPVVAFDIGGVAHQIGGTGVVVPAGDVEAFAEAVCALLADPDRRRMLGVRARERALTEFSAKGFAEQVRSVVAGSSGRGPQRQRVGPRLTPGARDH